MFSERFLQHSPEPNPQWEAKLSRLKAGDPVLDLTASNPTQADLPYPEGLAALFDRPETLKYEPAPRGRAETRAAIAAYYASRGRACDPGDLILTASTSEAYAFLFKLLCNSGDEILIPSPTYPLFDALADLEDVKLVRYPLRLVPGDGAGAARWSPDMDFLRTTLSTRCKALILVNPNNPTGHLADAAEIRAYVQLAQDYGLALIVDEVFSEYLLGDRPYLPVPSLGPLVFTLNGFSKMLALPQVKLGWIHVAGARPAVDAALAHLEWIADAFLSVNGPVQMAAPDLLRFGPEIRATIMRRLRANLASAERLAGGPIRILKPDGGWYVVLDIDSPAADEEFALELIKGTGVHAFAGSLFGMEGECRLVLSLLGSESEFAEGFRRIADFAKT